MIWTELTPAQKQDAVRQAVRAEGLTYAAAAERFGVSKNSIAGVMNAIDGRKGKKRRPPARANRGNKEPRPARKIPPRLNAFSRLPSEESLPPDLVPVSGGAWEALEGSSPVVIADHHDGCRWTIGADLPFLYCNEPVKAGSPYCPVHSARAFREPPPRKDNGRRDSH